MAAGVYPADIAIPSLPTARFLLRRLDGRAEAMIAPEQPGMATRLLAMLATTREGAPVRLDTLPLAVHDRLLAAVYRAEVGETVACRAACGGCAKSFEFAFPLSALIARQDEAAATIGPPDGEGWWTTGSGLQLRAPTLTDAEAGDGAALLARIARKKLPKAMIEGAVVFLEGASPMMSLDIATACPECGRKQDVWFDLAAFLIRTLAGERPFLLRETHLLAARYGWSHGEIMALPRDDRRAFAALIESERSAAMRRVS
jgi:hypothetical protein